MCAVIIDRQLVDSIAAANELNIDQMLVGALLDVRHASGDFTFELTGESSAGRPTAT